MKIEKLEDAIVWQRSKELALKIYSQFKECLDHDFQRQIQRSAVSIMNNIAEGFERRTNKEFIRFLYIAKGSCAEVRSMLYLALELKYISRQEFELDYTMAIEISKMLSGFIKTL